GVVAGARAALDRAAFPHDHHRSGAYATLLLAEGDHVTAAALALDAGGSAPAWRQMIWDVFGNPFRPVTLDPFWPTPTLVALARRMYESRDFSPMPILADALQDAGCDNDDILDHCRGDGPHVRGCWVVDMLLGKE